MTMPVVGALLALVLLSPLLAAIALAVKLTSPGPVLYRQQRMSLDGTLFEMLKFRSMRADAEAETGAMRLEREPVELESLVREVVALYELVAEESRIEVGVAAEEGLAVPVDRGRMRRVLANLLDNAIKYSEPGGSISLRIGGDDRSVRIEVADTGLGIPERDLGRIFERFYRVDRARSRSQGGTGLGLSIVKHMVQNLGGEIQVKSQLGRGSTFSFTLPRPA